MSVKRLKVVGLAVALFAGAAFSQWGQGWPSGDKVPQVTSHITVSKISDGLLKGQFTSIQAAVNRAEPGQIIEILDTATYAEQVTIDGRESHPWGSGITGGKNNITIRFVPWNSDGAARPKIVYNDVTNTSPKTCTEAQDVSSKCATTGDAPGCAGNFETNGALRIIRAQQVKIEGLIIDGGGRAPFGNADVWRLEGCQGGTCTGAPCPLFHGNAAVAVAVSGGIQLRDCHMRNAHFGIAVKDRNTGGVFGNPNPADNDNTVPLSGFGRTGNHLFEYNHINNNNTGIFFESSWDLGSTIRHNLIYNNTPTAAFPANMPGSAGDKGQVGAIVFKDNYLSPVAIYNNTFYMNAMNLVAGWQVGYHHLVFNNIFSRPAVYMQPNPTFNPASTIDHMGIDHRFPYRMFHCVFAANREAPKIDGGSGTCHYSHSVQMVGAQLTNGSMTGCTGNQVFMGMPITQLQGEGATSYGSGANIRWLETSGVGTTVPSMFKSVTPGAAGFLEPDWDNEYVKLYIRQKGWRPTTGGTASDIMSNENGTTTADLGAIPETGKRPGDGIMQKSRARISPFSVVTLSGTGNSDRTARASLIVDNELGTISAMKVRYLRWIAPVPDNTDAWGSQGDIVPSSSVRSIDIPAGTATLVPGAGNRLEFTIPAASATAKYGFFELVLEGVDEDGNKVVTDVGFLPYRELEYTLDIKVMRNGQAVNNPVVKAGEKVTIRVAAMNRRTGQPFQQGNANGRDSLKVEYTLFSDASSRMWRSVSPNPNDPLVTDPDLRLEGSHNDYYETYEVYFTKAGEEIIQGAGIWEEHKSNASDPRRISFLGELILTVRPGDPAKVVFQQPIPKRQLESASAANSIMGEYPVLVQVQDRFNNPTDSAVTVKIRSDKPDVGDVGPASALTDRTTGNASFTAEVTNGSPGEAFDMIASFDVSSSVTVRDTATLRVGRASDMLRVFYTQSDPPKHGNADSHKGGYWRDDHEEKDMIEENVRTNVPIWVKVVARGGDSVITTKNNIFVCVVPSGDDGNLMLAADDGGAPGTFTQGAIPVPVSNGVAALWITSNVGVDNARLDVTAWLSGACDVAGGTRDNSVGNDQSSGIYFISPQTDIDSAVISGADRFGRPNEVHIYYSRDADAVGFTIAGSSMQDMIPTSVTLSWPCEANTKISAEDITVVNDTVIRVTFNPEEFPQSYTTFAGSEKGLLVTVAKDPSGSSNDIRLFEKIGPMIAGSMSDAGCSKPVSLSPVLTENLLPETQRDELSLYVTEPLTGGNAAIRNGAVLQVKRGNEEFNVTVDGAERSDRRFNIWLTLDSRKLADGDSIRFVPGQDITDVFGNEVAVNGRYVRIGFQEVAPTLVDAWYTTDDFTGLLNYAYIALNKPVGNMEEWFGGGSFKFDWPAAGVETYQIPSNGENITLIGAGDTIRIDLAKAYPKSQENTLRNTPSTSGRITIGVTYGTLKTSGEGGADPWASKDIYANDRARPVLVAVQINVGKIDDAGKPTPDTLKITFSEQVDTTALKNISEPIKLSEDGNAWDNVSVEYLSHRQAMEFNFIVRDTNQHSLKMPSQGGRFPITGDLARINEAAGIADIDGNEQTVANNRPVPINVIYGKPDWRVLVKNNPFRGGSGGKVEFVLTPSTKAGSVRIQSKFVFFNNMGNIVLDTTVYNDPKNIDNSALEWAWDGRNAQGRFVGTGSYLIRITSTATIMAQDGKTVLDRHSQEITRMVGFVRGKSSL